MRSVRKMLWFIVAVAVLMVGCVTTAADKARQEATDRAESRSPYVQKNDVEFSNYNRRQQVADDPSAILWCTSAFPLPSSPLFTVPVVGKLTSGNKRPYETSRVVTSGTSEVPGPDGMYGSSGEYRYGFTPAGVYVDFYGLATFCTTEPTIWQREHTAIVMQQDPNLLQAQQQAQAALRAGKPDDAARILDQAIGRK